MTVEVPDPAELPPLNEETPALDAPVAVEWWHRWNDDGEPELDTFHGFHDAQQVADGDPPDPDGELVTESGTPVTDRDVYEESPGDSRYIYVSHRDALSRDIDPCTECFPAYATDHRLAPEREEGGILTEDGVEGAVFVVQVRHDLGSPWHVDSVHESYTSLLYRARAIRQQVGSAGERLRLSYMPVRQCDYGSFEEAMGFEPEMAHVTDLRTIQPGELSAVREAVGEAVLSTPVALDWTYSAGKWMGPSTAHRAEDAPCGYERAPVGELFDEDSEELAELMDADTQTVADVIERGNVVEFCATCFPELAEWAERDRD